MVAAAHVARQAEQLSGSSWHGRYAMHASHAGHSEIGLGNNHLCTTTGH